ncbi:delta-lactam-biosynthetic de-N-acetylase [Syntrophomonas curvata]
MKKLPVFLVIILLLALPAGCKEDSPSGSSPDFVSEVSQAPPPQTKSAEPAEPVKPAQQQAKDPAPAVPAAANNPVQKSYSWYFRPNSEHQPPSVSEDIRIMLANNDAFYVLPNKDNKIYLTFDEGYENGYTAQILDILKANNVRAAFFITGHYLKSQPELVTRMKNEGHLVCNHTLNHPDLSTVSQEKLEQETSSLDNNFRDLTGQEMDKYLRPPMGNYSPASLGYAREMGYHTVFWSMAFKDWDVNNQPGAEYSYQHVINNIHPGAVILLHAVSQSNTEALDGIIKDLTAQGYVFALFDR